MIKKELESQRQILLILLILTFGGGLILFLIGCKIQFQYLSHILKKDIIESRELIYDKIESLGTGRRKSVYFSGLIDSHRVRITFKRKYKNNVNKKLLVWYNPQSKNVLYYRKEGEVKFNPFNFFWYYFKWFLMTILPFLILLLLTYNAYKKYKRLKNKILTQNPE